MRNHAGDDYYKKQYDTVGDSRKKLQGTSAKELRTKVGIGDRIGTLDDIKLYEDYLKVSIHVIALSSNKKIIKGSEKYDNKLYLIHSQENLDDKVGHFDTVTKSKWGFGNPVFL